MHLIHFVEIRLIFMKLFLFILAGVILEVFVWIGVGDLVGSMWYVFFWFIAAFFIGMSLIRKYSAGLMPQMQQMQTGQMGADPALTNNLPKIIAGFLLLIPGLVTDVVAVLLLIPAVQKAMTGALMNVMMKRQQAMMEKMMGGMMGDMNGMGGGAQGQTHLQISCVRCKKCSNSRVVQLIVTLVLLMAKHEKLRQRRKKLK